MYRSIKIIIIGLFLSTMALAQTPTQKLILTQVRPFALETMEDLKNPNLTSKTAHDQIKDAVNILESSLDKILMSVNPADFADPKSELNMAYKAKDHVKLLSNLQLDSGDQSFTEDSCAQTSSLVRMGSTQGGDQVVNLSAADQNMLSLIDVLCRKN